MSDPRVRFGHLVPRGTAGEKASANPSALPGPPVPADHPAGRTWGQTPGQPSSKAAASPGQRRGAALPVAPWPAGIDVVRLLGGTLVAVLVIAAVWANRDLHEPVTGFGIVDEHGVLLAVNGGDLEVGDRLPAFQLRSTTDDVVRATDFEGQPLVIHIWNTWCLDCLADLPVMQQIAAQREGVAVVGISPDEPAERVARAAARHDATYPMLLDSNAAVASHYGGTSRPVTIVVDSGGIIVALHEGPVTSQQVEDSLAPLLP